MNLDKIQRELRNVQKSNMLPLTSVKTEDDKKKYAGKGYFVPFTLDEWEKSFPGVDPQFVFYLDGIRFDVVYYDADNFTCLYMTSLMLVKEKDVHDKMLASLLNGIQQFKQMANSEHPDYSKLLTTYLDGLRVDGLVHLLKKEGPGPVFYQTFVEMYTASDFFCRNLPKELMEVLPESKSEEQKNATEQRLKEKFGDAETITVYRGMTEESTRITEALSWTPNINIAYRFACGYTSRASVVKAVVRRQDIVEYITPGLSIGNEEEIIVIPGSVDVQEVKHLLWPLDDSVVSMMDSFRMVYLTYARKLTHLYDEKETHLQGHDTAHVLRVLTFALYLAESEHLSKGEIKKVAEAAIFHDIGRTDELTNPRHGIESAKIYEKSYGSDKVVSFIIRNHCIDDSVAEEAAKKEFSAQTAAKAMKLLAIVKDADALDRVRFGFAEQPGQDGLDVNYLRYELSKRLVYLAVARAKGHRLLES